MKCSDLKELLSGYADGELTRTQREFVEEHLINCPNCQATLADYKAINTKLISLRETSALSDIKGAVMSTITKDNNQQQSQRRILFKPVLRVAVPITLALIVFGTLWGTGVIPKLFYNESPISTPETSVPTPETPIPMIPGIIIPLRIEATTDKSSYLPGEEITITLSIQNVTEAPFIVSPYIPELYIWHLSGGSDEKVRIFGAGTDNLSLDPGQTATFTTIWDQSNDQDQQVPYGSYYISVGQFLTTINETAVTLEIPLSVPLVITILPAQGVMEKTIEINKTIEAAEGTVTLERIELSATEMKIYATYIPQDYVMPTQSDNVPFPPMSIHALAEYSVDEDILKNAGPSGIRWLETGIQLVWDNLDPIPNGSTILTFRITEIEKLPEQIQWQGPWEFKIPLQ